MRLWPSPMRRRMSATMPSAARLNAPKLVITPLGVPVDPEV